MSFALSVTHYKWIQACIYLVPHESKKYVQNICSVKTRELASKANYDTIGNFEKVSGHIL